MQPFRLPVLGFLLGLPGAVSIHSSATCKELLLDHLATQRNKELREPVRMGPDDMKSNPSRFYVFFFFFFSYMKRDFFFFLQLVSYEFLVIYKQEDAN